MADITARVESLLNSLMNPQSESRFLISTQIMALTEDPDFVPCLLALIQRNKSPFEKLPLYICLKSVVGEIFVKHKNPYANLPDKTLLRKAKQSIRDLILLAIKNESNRTVRKQIVDIFTMIVASKDQEVLADLADYHFMHFVPLYGTVVENSFSCFTDVLLAVSNLNKITNHLFAKKIYSTQNSFLEYTKTAIDANFKIWNEVSKKTVELIDSGNQIVEVVQLSRKMDKLMILQMCAYSQRNEIEEVFSEIVKAIFNKMVYLLVNIKKLEENDSLYGSLFSKELVKNAQILIRTLSNVVDSHPITFIGCLDGFFKTVVESFLCGWKSSDLQHSCAVFLLRILKTNVYSMVADDLGLAAMAKMHINPQAQAQFRESFISTFGAEGTVKAVFGKIYSQILPRRSLEYPEGDFEDEKLDEGSDVKEWSILKLGVSICERYFEKLTLVSLKVYYMTLMQIINREVALSDDVTDAFLSTVCDLPELYKKNSVPPAEQVPVDQVLTFLNSQPGEKTLFQSRTLRIIKSWLGFSLNLSLPQIYEHLKNALSSTSDSVLINGLELYKKLFQLDVDNQLDYKSIYNSTFPLFIMLIQKFGGTSEKLAKLGSYITALVRKTKSIDEDSAKVLQGIDFRLVIHSNELRLVINDTFKNLIIETKDSQNLSSVELFVKVFEALIESDDAEKIEDALNFGLVLIKNVIDLNKYGNHMKQIYSIFQAKFKIWEKVIQSGLTDNFLKFIEEFLLIGIPKEDFGLMAFLEKVYSKSKTFSFDDLLCIRSAVFSVYTTLLLISLESKSLDLANFEACLKMVIEEIVNENFDAANRRSVVLKTQVVSLFARFVLADPAKIWKYVSMFGEVSTFLGYLIQSCRETSSAKTQRLSSIMWLMNMEVLPPASLLPHLEHFIEIIIKTISDEETQKNTESLTKAKELGEQFSVRLERCRQSQLYEGLNLVEMLKKATLDFQAKAHAAGVTIQPFNNAILQEQFLKFIN